MEIITWLFDFAAICTISLFGVAGATGIFSRHSGLIGLAIGLFVGAILISITPLATTNLHTKLHINPEKSVVMQPLNNFASSIFEAIMSG